MTIRLSELSTLMILALVGAVLWMIRSNSGVTVVTVGGNDYEEQPDDIEMPWLGG